MKKDARNEERKARLEAGIRAVIGTPEGRLVLTWIAEELAGVARASFTASGSETSFREGKRSVGIALNAALLQLTPNEFAVLQREHVERLALAVNLERSKPSKKDDYDPFPTEES